AENTQNVNQHLVLRSPDLYTDAERLTPLVIRWDSFGNAASAPVRIDLYRDGSNGPQFVTNISPAAPDTGEYTWTPADSGIDYGTYGLRVQIALVGNPTVFERSTETFTVPENTISFY